MDLAGEFIDLARNFHAAVHDGPFAQCGEGPCPHYRRLYEQACEPPLPQPARPTMNLLAPQQTYPARVVLLALFGTVCLGLLLASAIKTLL